MSSTLHIRRTPVPDNEEWTFKQPLKGMLARKFYDHDGSLGGGIVTVGPEHLEWFEGLREGIFERLEPSDKTKFWAVMDILRAGGSVDLWFTT